MKIAAFIFARGGSKGLPGKNTRLLSGKPLIAWSIEQALAVDRIDTVIVSTDSIEIAEIAREYGAKVPFIRPAELAMDETPEWLAWRHAISFLGEKQNQYPEVMVSIPATSPLRLPIDIDNCLDEYEKGLSDAVIAVTDAHRNPYFNMIKVDLNDVVSIVNPLPHNNIGRRQDAPSVYDITTVCYVVNCNFIMNNKNLFSGRVKAVHVPVDRSIDIDTLHDFQIAEYLMQIRTNN